MALPEGIPLSLGAWRLALPKDGEVPKLSVRLERPSLWEADRYLSPGFPFRLPLS
ncbi:MAG: hypothetical protein KM310_07545 [Clostridiales bacterium]|nr:hypothetical protein [Clostridiales bacterium]